MTLLHYESLKVIYGKDLATGNDALGTVGNFETFYLNNKKVDPEQLESRFTTPIPLSPSPASPLPDNINRLLESEEIMMEIPNEEDYSPKAGNKLKRSGSVGSISSRKRGKGSAQENAAEISAKGMERLAASMEAPLPPQRTRFDECMEILKKMKSDGQITGKDFLRISRAFLKESEHYWALFSGMGDDMWLEFLVEENLLDLNY